MNYATMPHDIAQQIEALIDKKEGIKEVGVFDYDEDSYSALEGKRKIRQHIERERNKTLILQKRSQALLIKGNLACEACGFDLNNHYTSIGEGFCEVHHNKSLSGSAKPQVTKLSDLSILCSNCHRMIHKIQPLPSVESFKKWVR